MLGEDVEVDMWIAKLPDAPTHKDQVLTVLLRTGTNILVLYQQTLREPAAVDPVERLRRSIFPQVASTGRVQPHAKPPLGDSPVLHRVLTQVRRCLVVNGGCEVA